MGTLGMAPAGKGLAGSLWLKQVDHRWNKSFEAIKMSNAEDQRDFDYLGCAV
jgi:hypothetical protein